MYGLFERQSKFDQTKTSSLFMVVNMLKNWNHMYYSHHKIIKYIGFKSIHYAVNLDTQSSSIVFSEFDYVFLLDLLLV